MGIDKTPSQSVQYDDMRCSEFLLNRPMYIDYDDNGGLLIADQGSETLCKCNIWIDRAIIASGQYGASGFPQDELLDAEAVYSGPTGVAANYYATFVSNANSHTIVLHEGELVYRMAGIGSRGTPENDVENGYETVLNSPSGLTLDDSGDVIIADRENHIIRKMNWDRNIEIIAGVAGVAGFQDGEMGNSLFDSPSDVAIDPMTGNIIVADSGVGQLHSLFLSV